MKVMYYDNSNDVLTDEDHILFSSIVGRDIAELEAEIKKQDTRTIQFIIPFSKNWVWLKCIYFIFFISVMENLKFSN